jgi:hypothetical protein
MKKFLTLIMVGLVLFSCDIVEKEDKYDKLLKEIEKREKTYYIGKKIVNIRENPTTEAEIIDKLNINHRVYHMKDEEGNPIDSAGWYKIRFNKDSKEIKGWVFAELLSESRIKSAQELEKEKYLNLYSGTYVVAPLSSYSNEGFGLKSNGYAAWYWIENNEIRAKYEGSWTAKRNVITITVTGKSGKISETFIKKNGFFVSTDSSIRYLILN